MMRTIFTLIRALIVDLMKTYIFLLLHPVFIILKFTVRTHLASQIKQYLVRFILLPLFNIFFFISYHLLVKPIKKYYLVFTAPKLYNSSIFLREFNENDYILLNNKKSIYKYLIYNRENKYTKYPDPETIQDNLYYYLMSIKKVISPGWRQHHLHFYHEDLKQYRDVLYENALRIMVRQLLDVKLLDSFTVSLKSLNIFYRFVSNNISYFVYEYYCLLRYYNRSSFKLLDKLVNFKFLSGLTNLLLNLNLKIFFFNNTSIILWYLETLSLGEEGTERSIYLSKKFGFSGNLYLNHSYFMTKWKLDLRKIYDIDAGRMFQDYTHTEPWPFERRSIKGKNLRRLRDNQIATTTYPFNKYIYSSSSVENGNDLPLKEYMLRYRLPQTQMALIKNVYRYDLPKVPTYMINKALLSRYRDKVSFYTSLYSYLGKFTQSVLYLKSSILSTKDTKHNASLADSKLKRVFIDLDKLFVVVLILIFLESTFFIIKTLH